MGAVRGDWFPRNSITSAPASPRFMEWAFGNFRGMIVRAPPFTALTSPAMQTLHVNGYDMAYLEVGNGPPLVCVHGTLGDFRTWSAVLGPLSRQRRVIPVSLPRRFSAH